MRSESAAPAEQAITATAIAEAIAALVAQHGEVERPRIEQGVKQVAQRWWSEDGDGPAFKAFCGAHFLTSREDLDAVFGRFETVAEEVDGRLHEVRRELTSPLDLDTGTLGPLDQLLPLVDLAPHFDENLFRSGAAFLLLLNFPLHTLAERRAQAGSWSRADWARSRMTERFGLRVPAEVVQLGTRAAVEAERYISSYNIRLDRVLAPDGARHFPEGLSLISHWGLRDELSSYYAAEDEGRGLLRQRLIQRIMERIVRQEIPARVIDNPDLLWDPTANRAFRLDGTELGGDDVAPEPDTRYARWLAVFHAQQAVDRYSPLEPTFLARRFERDRQMTAAEVEALLESVLCSAEFAAVGRLIASRLGRPLEPFDLWYSGFRPRAHHTESDLDRMVEARYPDLAAFQQALPSVLGALGFAAESSRWLAAHIVVDPARGAGHAVGAVRRADSAHLRTRVPRGGMDYKGYNVALHELGHNIEQVVSLNGIDHWWLAGVPNTAFTEAFAFSCQHRDLELLGLTSAEGREVAALGALWTTAEIAGVSLVDLAAWRWLYSHPEATPAQFRDAVLGIAREVWNRHFLPVFGAATRDSVVLAIYSHMVAYGLYLPDYALGHLIEFQLGTVMAGGAFGREFERIAKQGRLTPEAWMHGAVGEALSAAPLLRAVREALPAA